MPLPRILQIAEGATYMDVGCAMRTATSGGAHGAPYEPQGRRDAAHPHTADPEPWHALHQ